MKRKKGETCFYNSIHFIFGISSFLIKTSKISMSIMNVLLHVMVLELLKGPDASMPFETVKLLMSPILVKVMKVTTVMRSSAHE